MKLSELKPNTANPRTITDAKFKKLCNSIKEFPKMMSLRPIVVDTDGTILGGNMRYKALVSLGYNELPDDWVKRADELTDQEKERFIVEDNVGFGDWDFEALANEFDAEQLAEWGVDVPEMKNIATGEAVDDNFDEDNEQIETKCKTGDIWQLGEHRLMCGDCTNIENVEQLFENERANLVLTDPPYNVAIGSKNAFLNAFGIKGGITKDIAGDKGQTDEEIGKSLWKPAFENLRKIAKDECSIYVSMPQGGTHMMMMMMMIAEAGWTVKHELIWLKNRATFSLGRLNYDYKHEPILYGWNKTHKWCASLPKNSILEFDCLQHCDLHPTMKPVALWSELITNSTDENDLVADFFCGSGTTIVACEQLGRKCYAMELDPHYCDVIIARWEKLTGKQAVKLN